MREAIRKRKIRGIPMTEKLLDVSVIQREIDWGAVRAEGFSGVMVKASQGRSEVTKGLQLFEDGGFRKNVCGASAAGLRVGAYHYLTAQNTAEAKKEAAFFLSVLAKEKEKITLWAAVDVESRYLQTGRAALTSVVKAFCEAVRAGGYYPMVYTNPDFLKNRLSDISGYPLWLANWLSSAKQSTAPTEGEASAMRGRYPAAVLWQWGAYAPGAVQGIGYSADGDYLLGIYPKIPKGSVKADAGNAGSAKSTEQKPAIREGMKVRVAKTVTVNGRVCAECYDGGYFRVWYDTYDVIQIRGTRAVIARDGVIAAAVPAGCLAAI